MTEAQSVEAAAINRELTNILVNTGRDMGLSVATEYPVPGGRLDVVWSWEPPTAIPGLSASIPVVGFEVESSWRTRKHVKGDLLNLQDAGVALGVIVLAGIDVRDDSLRRFASALVDRPGAQVLIWTADDVRALAAGGETMSTLEETATLAARAAPAPNAETDSAEHTGKHRALWDWLRRQERREFRISFTELEDRARITLPDSCYEHPPHWYSYQGSAVARAIIDADWHASRVDIGAGVVTLAPGPSRGRR